MRRLDRMNAAMSVQAKRCSLPPRTIAVSGAIPKSCGLEAATREQPCVHGSCEHGNLHAGILHTPANERPVRVPSRRPQGAKLPSQVRGGSATVLVVGIVTLLAACGSPAQAGCPLDHFLIGCNRDGIEGTEDDRTLFVDSVQKYRHSGETEYANWFYPLQKSIFPSYSYRIGEPGFDLFQALYPGEILTYDPNRSPQGHPDLDYRVVVECVALSAGLRAVHKDYPQFTIDAAGQSFDHSYIHNLRGDSHIHMSYQATDGEGLHWITFRVRDSLEDGDLLEPSEPFTIAFIAAPLEGDLAVDGVVDTMDLIEFSRYWLRPGSSRHNDYWERADSNRDGHVDLSDFARLAANWRTSQD